MDLVVSGILNFLTEQEAIGKADEVQDFYRYGIEITISSMLNIVLVLLMGALTGHLLESVIYLTVSKFAFRHKKIPPYKKDALYYSVFKERAEAIEKAPSLSMLKS